MITRVDAGSFVTVIVKAIAGAPFRSDVDQPWFARA
jgi:hypothetical protein